MIVGLSGKKQSGKDTVGRIIQYLTYTGMYSRGRRVSFQGFISNYDCFEPGWKTKQFAYKLKQIVCILIGCTMEQLEDNDFKEKELGEEWWQDKPIWCPESEMKIMRGHGDNKNIPLDEYAESLGYEKGIWSKNSSLVIYVLHRYIKLTPRKILQLLGTDAGRKIIHPNIWTNSLMNEYVEEDGYKYEVQPLGGLGMSGEQKLLMKSEPEYFNNGFQNWCITDVRFPEEVKAIEDRNGIILRIDRPGLESLDTHESETALDDYPFEHRVVNDGNIEDLIGKIKDFLTTTKILT